MELRDYLRILRKRFKLIVAITALCAAAGADLDLDDPGLTLDPEAEGAGHGRP